MSALRRHNALAAVALLIEHGADVNARDRDGETALMRAERQNNRPEVIALLIENGANAHEHRYR